MHTKLFATNLKCSGCVAAVTPFLNQVAGVGNWKVNLETADKVVTVEGDDIKAEEVIQAIKDAGYSANLLP